MPHAPPEYRQARSVAWSLLERVMGIEPTPSAWKAEVLPLNYTRAAWVSPASAGRPDARANSNQIQHLRPSADRHRHILVEGGGFEPPKAEPSDLQSDPFDRSGTPPNEQSAAEYMQPRATSTSILL